MQSEWPTPAELGAFLWGRLCRRPHWPSPNRVLHIVSSFQVGGMEHFVIRMAAGQQARGARVGVLALRGGPLGSEAARLGLERASLEGKGMTRRIAVALAHTARFRPDIVHVHNTSSLHYGTLCAGLAGCPLVMTFHGQGIAFPREPIAVEWWAVAAVAAVSKAAAQQLGQRVRGDKITVLHNGIDVSPATGARGRIRQKLGLGERPVVLVVARVDGLKGHRDLLHALAQLRKGGIGVTALIAGDGPERTQLESLGRELELDPDWLRFLGFRTDVAELLEAADVFVLPSLSEGLPLSLLEAMASGKAIVATDVGGIPEAVQSEKEALLVPPRNPEELAQALRRVILDAELRGRLGTAAAERAHSEFSFGAMLDLYDDLYGRVAAGHRIPQD
ncbi:glycosyltransferase family 4 protein [Myxococcota bacterium]